MYYVQYVGLDTLSLNKSELSSLTLTLTSGCISLAQIVKHCWPDTACPKIFLLCTPIQYVCSYCVLTACRLLLSFFPIVISVFLEVYNSENCDCWQMQWDIQYMYQCCVVSKLHKECSVCKTVSQKVFVSIQLNCNYKCFCGEHFL